LADKLAARGYATAALNGDIPQKQRETTVEKLRKGKIDILVATDVAARGLDVKRISHVINYDIPHDVEAYIHRIGRTGRAGRSGEAILFAANRERRLLGAIEKATGKKIEKMELPSAEDVTDKRTARFKTRITESLASRDLSIYRTIIEQYQAEEGVPVIEIAAALADLAQGDKPLVIKAASTNMPSKTNKASKTNKPAKDKPKETRKAKEKPTEKTKERVKDKNPDAAQKEQRAKPEKSDTPPPKRRSTEDRPDEGMERFRIEVGHQHEVKPGNIVGAISNEGEIDSEYIGRVVINEDHSTVDLPEGMPKELFKHLKGVWVCGQRLQISRLNPEKKAEKKPRGPSKKPPTRKKKKPNLTGKG